MNMTALPELSTGELRSRTAGNGRARNSNVMNILPLTTFRTIDLAGRKNPDSLLSIFWEEMEVFFRRYSAPKHMHMSACYCNEAAAWI